MSVGPILFSRGADEQVSRIAALLICDQVQEPPPLVPADGDEVSPTCIYTGLARRAWRYDFAVPSAEGGAYRLGDSDYEIHGRLTGDLRIAYVSCNGQEHEDPARDLDERNVMWRRLVEEHRRTPFGLILHGGDQLYADEVVQAHPGLAAWAASEPDARAALPFDDAMRTAAERFYLERYEYLFRQPSIAWLAARIPAIMIWDDHDILDGWGSRPKDVLESPIGRGLFDAARRMFLLFQRAESEFCADAPGNGAAPCQRTAGCTQSFPRFTVVVPDLRSQRTPERVMGPETWSEFERGLEQASRGDRILIPSSVPVLGPRLSWVEKAFALFPGLQRYEDDLRDQWQSRSHRAEWRRLLERLERTAIGGSHRVTILSGELHLATRAVMAFRDGTLLHQLVSSGIAHPPPPELYARALGALARIGESPVPGQRITLKPLPGQRRVYVPERNYMVLERAGGDWTAQWELESSGRTPPLPLR